MQNMNINTPALWTAQEAAVITGGKATQGWVATGICLKLEELKPGDLFFGSRDDNLDHVFAKGAAAAVVPHGTPNEYDYPLLLVGSVFDALRALARASRFRTHGLIVSVQGAAERAVIAKSLAAVSNVYEGGRHLSCGMAAMPEECDFGIFGFAPALRPDITIITDCKAAMEAAVLESMPDNAIVLINADDENFIDIFARARAAGLRNVFTFGSNVSADARMTDILRAGNGIRFDADILGEAIQIALPTNAKHVTSLLAAFMVMKMTDVSLRRFAQTMATDAYPQNFRTNNLSLMEVAAHKRPVIREAAFKVINMVDLGFGRRTLVLDKVTHKATKPQIIANRDIDIPTRLGCLDVVCASKGLSVFNNARNSLDRIGGHAKLEKIIPEVLAPGDYVVFRDERRAPRAKFSEALRMIPQARSA